MRNRFNLPLLIPFTQGMLGFYKNQTNPYSFTSMNGKEWERGYTFAYFENKHNVETSAEV